LSTIKPAETAGGTEGYIDFAVDDEGVLKGPWRFDLQPTIPGYVNTNNLSTIAGSGLDVVANQLVVTNVAGGASTFEELTGTNFLVGVGEVTNIFGIGNFVAGNVTGTNQISTGSIGSSQHGRITGTARIDPNNYGSVQRGSMGNGLTLIDGDAVGLVKLVNFLAQILLKSLLLVGYREAFLHRRVLELKLTHTDQARLVIFLEKHVLHHLLTGRFK